MMDWEAIGAVGEIVGAIAVVLSLAYLAIQIRQSNRLAIREARTNLSEIYNSMNLSQLETPHIAELKVKLRDRNCELSAVEKEHAETFASTLHVGWGVVGSAYDAGVLPQNVMEVYLNTVSYWFQNFPGLAPYIARAMTSSGIEPGMWPMFTRAWEEYDKLEYGNQSVAGT